MTGLRTWTFTAGALAFALAAPAAAQRQDLVFKPVPPCRVVDSRIGKGIPTRLVAGATHAVTFRNKCGVPGLTNDGGVENNTAAAVAINVVAVNADGRGHLRAWPANQQLPLASVINFTLTTPTVANGLIVPMCDQSEVMPFPCQGGDIAFLAEVSDVDLVIDVTGYFVKPAVEGARRYGVVGIDEFLCINNQAEVRYGLTKQLARWDTAAYACPAGTWVCTAYERGAAECNTARPDSFVDALSCAGSSIDYPAIAHRGWVRNAMSQSWAGMAMSEEANSLSEAIASCASLPVWCCSDY